MGENPYKSPREAGAPPPERVLKTWHPLTWAVVGFAGGTLILTPLVLSIEFRDRLQGGMLMGGPIGALVGLAHGLERRRKEKEEHCHDG